MLNLREYSQTQGREYLLRQKRAYSPTQARQQDSRTPLERVLTKTLGTLVLTRTLGTLVLTRTLGTLMLTRTLRVLALVKVLVNLTPTRMGD